MKSLNLFQAFIFRSHVNSGLRSRDKVVEKYTDQGWLQNKTLNISPSIIKSIITKGNNITNLPGEGNPPKLTDLTTTSLIKVNSEGAGEIYIEDGNICS